MAKDLPTNVRLLRNDWKTTGGKPLSYGSKYTNVKDVFDNVGISAYGPSVLRGGTNITKYHPDQKERNALAKEAAEILAKNLDEIYPNKCFDFNMFTAWEEKTASKIRKFYHENGVNEYTYGNAQKLINMAIKYLLSSCVINENDPLFKNCHFPVDGIIQKKLHKDFGIPYLPNKNHSWSRNDKWTDFVNYQTDARKIILDNEFDSPIICEISEWSKE